MSEHRELRAAVDATRSNVKASMRSLRATLQFLTDLDERLDALENRTASGGTANGTGSRTQARDRITA